jgi:subtilisin family serine protease
MSAATPIAAGVAALMLSVEPNLTSEEVRHYLCRSARDLGAPGRDDYYGWGRVDARAALDMILAKRADLNDDWVVDGVEVARDIKSPTTLTASTAGLYLGAGSKLEAGTFWSGLIDDVRIYSRVMKP